MAQVKKLIRAASGIHVVAIMTKPYPCPGKCVYCFGGPSYDTPQSYLGEEPALMRAVQNNFHPYLQVQNRLQQYVAKGHNPVKVEMIVMGGTFTALPLDYQEWFIAQAFKALNDFPYFRLEESVDIEEAKKLNERARVRCTGLTLETRPDYAKRFHIDNMLRLGATRVEIGVQTVYDDVLELVHRGHGVEESIAATRRLKDAGLKVVYHMMIGLPGMTPQKDLEAFKTIFTDSRFMPDMIKIYPTLVIKGSKLYEWWIRGDYEPYSEEVTIDLVAKILSIVPPWVRVMRVHRDVPAPIIEAGVKKSNLRELAMVRLRKLGLRCREIRCREAGINYVKRGILPVEENIKLVRYDYEASGGHEVFLSFEDVRQDLLIGILRLRIPSEKAWRYEIRETSSAIVRELHVYSLALPLGERSEVSWQHRGYGRRLLMEAERIAREEFDVKKILVMSGIGVKEYYRKLGYRDDGVYVSKTLV